MQIALQTRAMERDARRTVLANSNQSALLKANQGVVRNDEF